MLLLAVNCVKSHWPEHCYLWTVQWGSQQSSQQHRHASWYTLVWAGFANAAAADACGNILRASLRASMVDVSKILFFYLSGLWHCSLPDCHSSSSSTSQRRAVSQSVSFPEEAKFFSFYFLYSIEFYMGGKSYIFWNNWYLLACGIV